MRNDYGKVFEYIFGPLNNVLHLCSLLFFEILPFKVNVNCCPGKRSEIAQNSFLVLGTASVQSSQLVSTRNFFYFTTFLLSYGYFLIDVR